MSHGCLHHSPRRHGDDIRQSLIIDVLAGLLTCMNWEAACAKMVRLRVDDPCISHLTRMTPSLSSDYEVRSIRTSR